MTWDALRAYHDKTGEQRIMQLFADDANRAADFRFRPVICCLTIPRQASTPRRGRCC